MVFKALPDEKYTDKCWVTFSKSRYRFLKEHTLRKWRRSFMRVRIRPHVIIKKALEKLLYYDVQAGYGCDGQHKRIVFAKYV